MTIPYMKVASWCSYWQLVVEVSREKQAVRWLVTVEAEVIMAKEEKSDNGRKTWGRLFFFQFYIRFSSPLSHEIHPYL
jgi:hypothetical protein